MKPEDLSRQLREDRSPELQRRRWLVGLSLVGVAAGQIVSLYQMGILKRLPSVPLKLFDATKVDKAPYAYKRAQTPDALLMIVSYGVTACLAGAGGRDRARSAPWLPLALFAKVAYDSALAVKLGTEEYRDTKRLCDYCQVATLASIVSAVIAAPEAWSALKGVSERTSVESLKAPVRRARTTMPTWLQSLGWRERAETPAPV